MAAVAAILRAVARTVGRDLRSLDAVHGNNFFWILMLIMYQQPSSGIFLGLILLVLLILPFTAEPLRKIPPDRMALWPLSRSERFALRAGSLALESYFLDRCGSVRLDCAARAGHCCSLAGRGCPRNGGLSEACRFRPTKPQNAASNSSVPWLARPIV